MLERGGDGFEQLCGDTALALADGRFLASSLQDEDALYLAGGLDENGVLLKSFTRVSFSDLRDCLPTVGEDLTILKEARAYSGRCFRFRRNDVWRRLQQTEWYAIHQCTR